MSEIGHLKCRYLWLISLFHFCISLSYVSVIWYLRIYEFNCIVKCAVNPEFPASTCFLLLLQTKSSGLLLQTISLGNRVVDSVLRLTYQSSDGSVLLIWYSSYSLIMECIWLLKYYEEICFCLLILLSRMYVWRYMVAYEACIPPLHDMKHLLADVETR